MKNHLLLFVVLISGFLFSQSYSQENKQIKKIYKIKDFIERVDTFRLERKNGEFYDTSFVWLIPKNKLKNIYFGYFFVNLLKLPVNEYYYCKNIPLYLKRSKPPYEIYDTIIRFTYSEKSEIKY